MTEFQVGDRVSVEGVVESIDAHPSGCVVRFSNLHALWVSSRDLTLFERPKRKLRVGSVWEYTGPTGHARWLVLDDQTLIKLTPPKCVGAQVGDQVPRSEVTIDYSPDFWREVPVEELEREAQA